MDYILQNCPFDEIDFHAFCRRSEKEEIGEGDETSHWISWDIKGTITEKWL